MRKIFFGLVVMIMLVAKTSQATPSPQWVRNLHAAQISEQMVVVAGIQKNTAWISMHELIDGQWQQIMTTPGFIGVNGLGKVREGDHKTPVGTFRFDCAFGIAPDPGCALGYTQIDVNHYWSGDWNYKYNQLVDVRNAPANFNRRNSEHLITYNPHYMYGLNIGYNSDCTPGRGAALFMHCFGPINPWTLGCVALPEEKMRFVMQHIKSGCVCVIDSLEGMGGKL
ncbi:MAG: L,D-transpeptidase family protein [Quinella sp. 2Q5]|nr:L,D-transpeptidase family protein [Quinella sp. 2Q5]